MLSICMELLSNRRRRVVVDGTSREWIQFVSGVPQGSVLGNLIAAKMFDLVED